jgi:hypothetical protein
MDPSFTIAAGPRQRSHSHVRVPRDSWSHFTVSDSRLPQPGGPGPRNYIPQEQGGPVIPPGTGFPFLRLLRLAELQWRYSWSEFPFPYSLISSRHGPSTVNTAPLLLRGADHIENTFPLLLLEVTSHALTYLLSRSLAMRHNTFAKLRNC